MLARLKPFAIGLLTWTPLARRYGIPRTGGTDDPRYCYAVFARHLIHAHRSGMDAFPRTVAELGPGDSIGTGLAWLLAGAERYLAFDVRRYAAREVNLEVFDALVDLFRRRAPIPGEETFPELKPPLDAAEFPREWLDDARLDAALAPERVERLRRDVENLEGAVDYVVPWDGRAQVRPGSVDFLFSQAVLEHVEDVEGVHRTARAWVRPGGFVSHQIDFKSHGTAPGWDGYRAYREWQWAIVRGRRSYLINRVPDVGHLDALERHGFETVTRIPAYLEPTLAPARYAPRFRDLDADSRRTAGLFVQARVPAGHPASKENGTGG